MHKKIFELNSVLVLKYLAIAGLILEPLSHLYDWFFDVAAIREMNLLDWLVFVISFASEILILVGILKENLRLLFYTFSVWIIVSPVIILSYIILDIESEIKNIWIFVFKLILVAFVIWYNYLYLKIFSVDNNSFLLKPKTEYSEIQQYDTILVRMYKVIVCLLLVLGLFGPAILMVFSSLRSYLVSY